MMDICPFCGRKVHIRGSSTERHYSFHFKNAFVRNAPTEECQGSNTNYIAGLNIEPSCEERIATLEKNNKELVAALENLVFPNVPSADDLRMLIVGVGGSSKSVAPAMKLADNMEVAQKQARSFLSKYKVTK